MKDVFLEKILNELNTIDNDIIQNKLYEISIVNHNVIQYSFILFTMIRELYNLKLNNEINQAQLELDRNLFDININFANSDDELSIVIIDYIKSLI
jgi:hypothetical protein